MNCGDIDGMLVEGSLGSPFSIEAEDHVRGCARCRALVCAVGTSALTDQPLPATLRQIESGMIADYRPVRPVAPGRYVFAAFVAIFIAVVAVEVHRVGARAIRVLSPVQIGVILGILAIGAGLQAYSLVHQMVPGRRHRISPRWLPVGIVAALAIAMAVLFQFQLHRHSWARNWACLKIGIPVAAVAGLLFWLVLRRGAVLSPAMTGAATGLLAGMAGASVLEVHCPNRDVWHILISHLGVAVLGGVVGFTTGLTAEIRPFSRHAK